MRVAIAIETSTRRPSVAAALIGQPARVAHLEGERAHASDLLPMLDFLLAELGAPKEYIERVVVGLGPGSLTGLRVGAATALGIARAAGASLVGVASFEAAVAALAPDVSAALVIGDARGGHFDTAVLSVAAGVVRFEVAPAALDVTRAGEFVEHFATNHASAAGAVFVLSDESSRARFELELRLPLVHHRPIAPDAGVLLQLGLGREPTGRDVAPLYLREFEVRAPRRR